MKIFLHLVVWILLFYKTAYSQSRKNIGRLKHEVFFLNLEDGYFGCQVNESTDYLQLYELSKLCDGKSDCFMGSDELRKELKCSNDCTKDDTICSNGVCLDSLCHCNDGFGGCNCQVPDENECKYRPCDVFAHCTNTLGSFTCTCFPGYHGDGLHCEDIDECADPAIAARCVENAECCNLPAHFLCKCKEGFEGDGEQHCQDINECERSNVCGINTNCINKPGNYSCECQDGYEGIPYDGCVDINECENPNACGHGATCTNLEGNYRCDCPIGFDGDARTTGCVDYDECARSPCGRGALCRNNEGSFKCTCPDGMKGDPMDECKEDLCQKSNYCGNNTLPCENNVCTCEDGFTGDPYKDCIDIDECSTTPNICGDGYECNNSYGGYACMCTYLAKCRALTSCDSVPFLLLPSDTSCRCPFGFYGRKPNCQKIFCIKLKY